MTTVLASQMALTQEVDTHAVTGRVTEVTGLTVGVVDLHVPVGSMCRFHLANGKQVAGSVVGLRDDVALVVPLEDPQGIARGDRVESIAGRPTVRVGPELLGRVIDGMGNPIDDKPAPRCAHQYPIYAQAAPAMDRREIEESLGTGIRAIDALITVGLGQRVGVFSATGVGKSTLLGMIARYTNADCLVMAMIGERGREVGDFLRRDLGPEGLKRSVVVVATSDQSPVLRVRACFVAATVAEYFRDQGRNVLLLMDSLTRMALAQRQIGLAAGEPPTTRGYTPSTFALLPKLLERAGRTKRGSITGFYSVLVEGDDPDEPISDAVRGILDGHVWLSRTLANRKHYPAVSTLESVSRLMPEVTDEAHQAAAKRVLQLLATWQEIEDLVNIGAYAPGTNPRFDLAIQMKPKVDDFLQQLVDQRVEFGQARKELLALAAEIQELGKKLDEKKRGRRT